MISPIICKVHVLKLVSYGKPDERQRAIKGNSIAFLQDVKKVAKLLPDVDASCKYLKVCFVGDETRPLPIGKLKKLLRVRKDKVRKALEFLTQHHIGFRELGITIDYDVLDTLPDDDIPENILENISRSSDTSASAKESSSYVPQEPGNNINNSEHIPVDRSCVLDIDSTLVDPEELLIGASKALLSDDEDESNDHEIHIEHNPDPVSSYNNPSFWTLAFPTLFPYGIGGCDDQTISLKAWTKHLLNLHDTRFCTHYNFLFVAYSYDNVRNVCSQANLSIERSFDDPHPVHSEDLKQAIEQINSGQPPRAPGVARLWKQLKAVGSNVVGSNFHRHSLSYEIKALMMIYGLPTFFVTVNPADLNHPLVLHFAGKDINLDRPFTDGWLDKAQRARLVASNPVAVAKFFNTLITIWLKTIVGANTNPPHEKGIFGRTQAHYGTVETQGRGSLHLHLLFWIHGSLSPEELAEKLNTVEFPPHLLKYLESIISEQFPGGNVVESSTGDEDHSCCSQRPPDPDDPDVGSIVESDLTTLIQKCQIHKHTDTCYKYNHTSCRFEFERPEVEVAKIENGVVWLQRKTGNGWVNNYNDIILLTLRCNHDVKYISNGRDGKAVAFYITSYITKNALSTHNAFPIMLAASDSIEAGINPCADRRELTKNQKLNRELVVKCVNKLTTHAERSGPEIATLLLGLPLHYTDHTFEKLFINPFLSAFDKTTSSVVERFSLCRNGGDYQLVNQKLAYLSKPTVGQFANLSLFDFVRWFYKARIPKTGVPDNGFPFLATHPQFKTHYMQKRTLSPPKVPVIVGKWLPTRSTNPELYAQFFFILFKSFSRLDDLKPPDGVTWSDHLDAWDWDSLEPEQKLELEKYTSNIQAMNSGLDQQKLEQEERRKLRKEQGLTDKDVRMFEDPFDEIFAPLDDDIPDGPEIALPHPVVNTTLGCFALTALSQLSIHGGLDGDGPINVPDGGPTLDGSSTFVFPNHPTHSSLSGNDICTGLKKNIKTQIGDAKETDLSKTDESKEVDKLLMFVPKGVFNQRVLEAVSKGFTLNVKQNEVFMKIGNTLLDTYNHTEGTHATPPKQLLAYVGGPGGTGKSQIINAIQDLFRRAGKKSWLRTGAFTGSAASNVNGSTISGMLKDSKHSNESLTLSLKNIAGLVHQVGQMRFLIIDEVSMISCHMLSKLDARLKQASSESKKHIMFGGVHVIFFGDFIQYPCVAGTDLYEPISPHVQNKDSKSNPIEIEEDELDDDESGDESGDENDVPEKEKDITSHITGRTLWSQLNYARFLTQQMRCQDTGYLSMLTELRNRSTTMANQHATFLATRTLGSSTSDRDATCAEFANAPIITTRNAVRVAINFSKAKVHAKTSNKKLVILMARDRTSAKAGPLDLEERKKLLHKLDNKTENLPGMLPLVSNMPLVVKANIATELGICNGTRCFFSRIVMDPDEPVVNLDSTPTERNVHFLKKIPLFIVVKVPNPKFKKFDFLEEEIVEDSNGKKTLYREFPIFPVRSSFKHDIRTGGVTETKTISRSQFPLLPGYAITGYTAQGQTFGKAIIDLRVPEGQYCGPTNPADLYVLLSRMKTREGLLILRAFQPTILQKRPRKVVFDEIARLEDLSVATHMSPSSSSSSSCLSSSLRP